jgi:integrase
MAVFKKQGVYWIDYYVNGHRKRERIGLDKRLAENVLRKRKVEIAEGKYLDKQRPVTTTFDELAEAYLLYARDQQQKRSWTRDRTSLATLKAYFSEKRLTELTPASIEQYRTWRRATISRRGRPVTPASINRELACLKRMFNVARRGLIVLRGGGPQDNPMISIAMDRENNARDRVLSKDEFDRLLARAPSHLKPILLTACYTGMRRGELLKLTWDRVDLKAEVIRLRPEDTKTQEGRTIPLTKELTQMLQQSTIYLTEGSRRVPHVFTYGGKPIGSIRLAFETACQRAGISGVVFHDLRYTFVTNMRRAGVDYFRIMAITGHRTMAVFKRYHTIDHQDLHQAIGQLDTYMDTMPTATTEAARNALKSSCPRSSVRIEQRTPDPCVGGSNPLGGILLPQRGKSDARCGHPGCRSSRSHRRHLCGTGKPRSGRDYWPALRRTISADDGG